MSRYFTQTGSYPNIEAQFHLAGPQDESQIDEHTKAILERPGIKAVAIEYDHGLGPRITIIQKIPETAEGA